MTKEIIVKTDFHWGFNFTSVTGEFKDREKSVILASDFIFIKMQKNRLCPKMIEKLWFGWWTKDDIEEKSSNHKALKCLGIVHLF